MNLSEISWDAPGESESQIHDYVSQIMDMNHQAMTLLRERATDFDLLGKAFLQMAEWAHDAGDQCRIKARQLADLSGDAIATEYQLVPVEDDDNIEEEEDDEGDPREDD